MRSVSAEWEAQGDSVNIYAMPLTRLLTGMLDQTEADLKGAHEEMVAYAEGDTLRYHAPEDSPLGKMQAKIWKPWLKWAEKHFSMDWTITDGLMPLASSADIQRSITQWLGERTVEEMMALLVATQMLGSFIMAAALVLNACTPELAMESAWLEQDFQMMTWGRDEELLRKRALALEEIKAAQLFIRLIHPPAPASQG